MISHSGRSRPGTYTEWRVHGVPDVLGQPYEFVWSELLNEHLGDAEVAAKNFREMIASAPERHPVLRKPWLEGPHLSKRTITITEWVADGP